MNEGVAVFGKLPGHGDFVRRGDPPLINRLDLLVAAMLGHIAGRDDAELHELLAKMPSWCFRMADGLSGAVIPSRDRVGRDFPVAGAVVDPATSPEAVLSILEGARDAGGDADCAVDRLRTMPAGDDASGIGWWRPGTDPAQAVLPGALPTGEAFASLWNEI